jgi:hypothetical protein
MTAQLLTQLESWARERRILPQSFDCPHYDKCNGSLLKNGLSLNQGHTCYMSYAGQDYGQLTLSGKPFRMILVG